MSKSFKLKILTPSTVVVYEEVGSITVKSEGGYIQVLPGHEEMIISTIPCITHFVDSIGSSKKIFTSQGILNIQKEIAYFCLDAAEFPEYIDLERAESAKLRAENKIKEGGDIDLGRAKACLERAKLRIELKEHS